MAAGKPECVQRIAGDECGSRGLCALAWDGQSLHVLDQTQIPDKIEYIICTTAEDVAEAIRSMRVRGAPAIGAAAAYGMVLAALELHKGSAEQDLTSDAATLLRRLSESADHLIATRPTAVNLKWAVKRVLQAAREASGTCADVLMRITDEADAIAREDVEINRSIGRNGAELLADEVSVLTHCNTGSLATVGYGTALGVIRAAVEMGKRVRVYADETRPFLQGSRLTAFELMQDGIDVTLIVDSAAAYLMKQGKIDVVVVGADRITANGDIANKIGTYSVACLARQHGIPFYVAAPMSTVDLSLASGDEIPIEERGPEEVTSICGKQLAPPGARVVNPAFDVTPASLVSAIITELGVLYAPFLTSLKAACGPAVAGAEAESAGHRFQQAL